MSDFCRVQGDEIHCKVCPSKFKAVDQLICHLKTYHKIKVPNELQSDLEKELHVAAHNRLIISSRSYKKNVKNFIAQL